MDLRITATIVRAFAMTSGSVPREIRTPVSTMATMQTVGARAGLSTDMSTILMLIAE
jgi:hypothetical protein